MIQVAFTRSRPRGSRARGHRTRGSRENVREAREQAPLLNDEKERSPGRLRGGLDLVLVSEEGAS